MTNYQTQYQARLKNHEYSASYKARHTSTPAPDPDLKIGDKVYVKSDLSKNKARDLFIVLQLNKEKEIASLQNL